MLKSKKKKKNKKEQSKEQPTLPLKERLAQKRKATRAREELTSLLSKAGGVGIVLGIALFFVGGIKLAVPAVMAVIVIALSYKYPRQALFGFVFYIPFAGTVTYLLGGNAILQLAKDGFYVPAVIALWQKCRQQNLPFVIPKGIKTPLLILLTLCICTLLFVNGMQQFNPEPPALFKTPPKEIPLGMGILGLKVLMGYIPLITCAYYLIRNKKDFLFVTRLQVVLILLCCVLGVVQYALLVAGICEGTRDATGVDLFKATLEARCFIGGALVYSPSQGIIRLPGTFVAPWQWAWFLISSTFFTFGTGFSDPSLKWRLFGLVSLGAVFVNAVISGQRIALALVPACLVLLLVLTGQFANLKRFVPIFGGLILILTIAIASNPVVVQERMDSFISRWNASPPYEFITQQFEEVANNTKNPLGNGLGRATNSARIMGPTKLVETYYPKVMFEVGILGVLGFLGLVTTLTVCAFKTYRKIKNRNFRGYGAALWVFILFISYNTYYYPLDVDPVAVYYWFFAGVLFKLPEIDKLERLKEEQNQEVQEVSTIRKRKQKVVQNPL
ncbi:hormogonium polysaccharide biosynthesis protein HpsL [Rivularia sp. UHCC 0363]|uniref:hormogonium polysaccharide biosynthesis protein HpsL n=1 Tax=Rivularia sp. UHCC 0363 TaxID=3110244 RepID=UPI002B1E96D7|nr:hormogonium polysaccharide biosynthesis protein HpsL [Rivularia sp. UHCC 0363]MEA5599438.1 hormogonium polysaccharide biosynthesis protein HpsL [Rivularia sp. UHCC 0363]